MKRSIVLAMLLLSIVVLSPAIHTASASEQTWTSTADFDGGVKEQPTVARNWFLANGISQPENFINYPAAVYFNGRTYVAYQGEADNDATTLDPFITYYDHSTSTWAAAVQIGICGSECTSDDHGAPSLLVDSTSYLHVFCCAHNAFIEHFKSNAPESISSWTRLAHIGAGISTYPHPVRFGSTVYLIYRNINGATNIWVFVKSLDNGATWGSETTIFEGTASLVGYIGNVAVSGTKVFVPFANAAGKNAYVAYLETTTDHMFCKAAGSDVDLGSSISEAEADANCRVENTGTGTDGGNVVHVDGSGNPYTIYVANVVSANFNFSYWTGAAWSAPVSITSGQTTSNQNDFIVNSATDIDAFLTTSGLGTTDRGGDIEKWHWNGAAWAKASTIMYEKYAAATLNNPIVPWNFNAGLKFIFCETRVDIYSSGGDQFDKLRCYAHDGTNFVTKPDVLGTYATETNTDNPGIASGQLELASGKGDSFGVADTDATTFRWHPGRYQSAIVPGDGRTLSDVATKSPGNLYLSFFTGNGNADAWGVISNFTISGDFEAIVDPHQYPSFGLVSTNRIWLNILNEDTISMESSSTVDGVAWYEYWQTGSMRLWPYTITNGVGTVIGPGAGPAEQDWWLRITRVTNTITWYYSSDGSAWTNLASTSFAFSGASHVTLSISANSGGRRPQYTVNNFQFVSTTLDAGGYRTSGSWTSPTLIGKAAQVRLTYSGLSSTAYIDKVELLSDGVVKETFGSDITSGTASTLVSQESVTSPVSVRVTLAGNGASTPVLESVALVVTESAGLRPPSPGGWWQFPDMSFLGSLYVQLPLFLILLATGVIIYTYGRQRPR